MLGAAGPEDFGSEIDFERYFNIFKTESTNIDDLYYITSILSYESDRCMLHGHSIMHYIIIVLKFILKKLLRLIVRLIFQLLLNPYTYLVLAVLFIIYAYILPQIKKRWKQINTLVCKIEDFHTPRIATPDITNPIGIGPDIIFHSHELIGAKYPFAGMFNKIFGDGTFDCANNGGSDWNSKNYGTCGERFGGENREKTGCNSGFATDYSLWDNNSNEGIKPGHTLCNNKIFCINSPESYIVSNTSISDFTPIINNGINRGTSPFKYLACCSGQKDCPEETINQAIKSINFANKFPKYGMDIPGVSYNKEKKYIMDKLNKDIPDISERVIYPWNIWSNDNEKKFGNFKPISMYQAIVSYFRPITTWSKIGDKYECVQGSVIGPWLSKTIWTLIALFFIYELYYFIYDINYAEEMHADYNENKNGKNCQEILVKHVNNYLCNKDFDKGQKKYCNNLKVNKAVEKFGEHIKLACNEQHPHQKDPSSKPGASNEGGFFKKLMNSHKFHKNGCEINMNKNKNSLGSHNIINGDTNINTDCAKAKGLDSSLTGIAGTGEIDILHVQLLFGFMIISCILTYIIVYILNNKKKNKKQRKMKDKEDIE
jgi:hypothetical protein